MLKEGYGSLPLAPGERLSISALARSLRHVNTSYKFLWLLGLLDSLPSQANSRIPVKRIINGMLEAAAEPVRCNLFLGKDDRMKSVVMDILKAQQHVGGSMGKLVIPRQYRSKQEELAFKDAHERLEDYVPQQWLVPFLKEHVKQPMPKSSTAVARLVREIAHEYAACEMPVPYFFEKTDEDRHIVLNPKWHAYFERNRKIVMGWVLYSFIEFLQARNPHTPGIINKILHSKKRFDLNREREWWDKIIKESGTISCIYSEKPIRNDFHLDHYIPFSYVGHNHLWNLAPVIPKVNLSKRDRLPSEEYLDRLIGLQHQALDIYSSLGKGAKRYGGKLLEGYVVDLKMENISSQPPSRKRLSSAYRDLVLPLTSLASNDGFETDWRYDENFRDGSLS